MSVLAPPKLDSTSAAALPFPERRSAESNGKTGDTVVELVRVLHLINGEHYSGAERVQDLLAQRLPEFGFEVSFACVKPDLFPRIRQCRQARLWKAPMKSRIDLRSVLKLAAIVRRYDYKLLHAHTPRTLLLGRLTSLMTKRPLVYHVHSPTSRDSTRKLQNRVNEGVERVCLWGNASMITVSHSLGHQMRSLGFPDHRISVVANGVPQASTVADRSPPSGQWVLGMVALFRPRKGVEVLLEALGQLKKEGCPVRLQAIGPFETPEYEQQLRDLARAQDVEDIVHWTGFCDDVPKELAAIDLFVLPSLFGEGLPMVVLEAMAAGAPVVATRVEGVPEAVRDGVDGVLANPQDPVDLARAIREVIQGKYDWSVLRRSALARQAEHFSDRSMAAGVARVYRRMLGTLA